MTNSITAFFSILLATNRSTALTIPVHRCVPYGAFEMLERLAGKLARAVLRGGGGGNVASLPDPAGSQPPFGSSICSIPAITAKHSLSPASFTPSVVPLACAWATTFAHGTGGAYHVPLDRQLCAFRGFLSPGHATNDEMAMRQRHSLMAYLFWSRRFAILWIAGSYLRRSNVTRFIRNSPYGSSLALWLARSPPCSWP